MRGDYFDTGHGQIRAWLTGDRPGVLVLPGIRWSGRPLAEEAALESPGHPVAVADLPGVGGSAPGAAAGVGPAADALAEAAAALGAHSEGQIVPVKVEPWELVLVLALVCLFLARLARSRFGTAAVATREDPTAAATMGVPVRRIQIAAFLISGVIAGVGGVLQASLLRYIDPDTFYIDLAVTVIACVVLGGAYHWFGSVIGAVVFTGLPVYVNQFISQGQSIINGVLLLVIMIWVPGGLIDPLRWRRLRERRAAAAPAPEAAREVAEVGT